MSQSPFNVEMQLRRHGAALRELAGEMVRDPGAADDAVQEVWLGALRRPPPHETALGGWLATALRNVVRGFCRKERRSVRRELAVAAARGEAVEDHAAVLAREEQAQRLLAAVTALAAPFRETIWQRYFEGKAPREIAASSGVNCATVKSRLQRGLQQLRGKLGDEGEPGWRGALAVAFGWQGTVMPSGVATMACPGVLLMTTWMKSIACLAVLAATGVLLWSPRDPGVASPGNVAAAEGGGIEVARPREPADRDGSAQTNERILLTPNVVEAALTFLEVRVRNEAGEPVPAAMVLHVKPGFAYSELPPEQKDRYSRSSESYLRDFGLAQMTDEHGSTRVPIAAAQGVVVARKGSLYGAKGFSGATILEIVITAHHTLVVETVDALGAPVPHVTVVGQPVSAKVFVNPMAQWTLGTTNDNGILTQVLKAPSEADPELIWLHAELLDGAYGREAIDARAPPAFVRLTLPARGMVRARIQNADGSTPDRLILQRLHAELALVGANQPTLQSRLLGTPGRLYAQPDAEGNACFENIVLGQTLQLRFPGLVVTPRVFRGPTEREREVTIVQTIESDHPFVVGTLVDPDGRPIVDATFTIFCPSNRELLLCVGGKTDAYGRFATGLTDRCTGQSAVVLSFGMDWRGTGPTRQVSVPVTGPLLGKVDLGAVAMPNPK